MKNRFVKLLIIALLFLAWTQSNPPIGMTGAPNEKTCSTAAACHGNGNYTGFVELFGIPDTISPNTTYSLRLKTTAKNAVKGGFQITSLNSINSGSGIFLAALGVNAIASGGKSYARQTIAKKFSDDTVSWSFDWKSPAMQKDSIRFFFSALCTNGNGNTAGDNTLVGSKVVVFKQTTSTEVASKNAVTIYPNPVSNVLYIENVASNTTINIFTSSGSLLSIHRINNGDRIDVSRLQTGVYIIQIDQPNFFKRQLIKVLVSR